MTCLCLMSRDFVSCDLTLLLTRNAPISIDVVVEGQFLILQYMPLREDAHAHKLANCPFSDVAVGITTMVCESTNSSTLCGVDELFCTSQTGE